MRRIWVGLAIAAAALAACQPAPVKPGPPAPSPGSPTTPVPPPPPPTVTGLSPIFELGGTGGEPVTITGTNFAGTTAVRFGANAATDVNVVSATEITATSPAGTGVVNVRVTTPGGTSAVSANNEYAYLLTAPDTPTVTALDPSSGPEFGLNQVVITGTELSGAVAVTFGLTLAAFTVDNDAQITATAPPGTGTVDVRVATLGGTSDNTEADDYTYVPGLPPAPEITALTPDTGPALGGHPVVITGTDLASVNTVRFDLTPAVFTIDSDTQITAIAPPGVGQVDVTVTSIGGTSDALVYTYDADPPPAPTITGVDPNEGPLLGGNAVTITGTNLGGALLVTFGAVPAVVTANSDTEITATAPAGVLAGTVDVTVSTLGGASVNTPADDYTYFPLPVVVLLTPATGSVGGGDPVTIAGTGFTGATEVRFGGVAATNVVVVADTEITATAPAGTGIVLVTVTTPGGTSLGVPYVYALF